MMEMVIGTMIVLIVAVIAIFLILIAINIALLLKLRSSIPQKHFSNSEHREDHAGDRTANRRLLRGMVVPAIRDDSPPPTAEALASRDCRLRTNARGAEGMGDW